MEIKNRVIRVENVPKEPIIYREKTKPVKLLSYVVAIGMLAFLFQQRILGFFLMAIAGYALFVLREDSLVDITKRFVIVYDQPNKKECTIVYWKEIINWSIEKKNKNNVSLNLFLDDGFEVMIYIINIKRIRELMRKIAPEREVEL